MPSKELLEKVRTIAAYQLGFSSEVARDLGEEGLLRSYLGDQLRSLLNQLDIQVSIREVPGFFGKKFKVVHRVAEKGTVQLEFTYLIRGADDKASRTLESVSRYQPGDWEQKIDMAYQKCVLDLRGQWEQVNLLMKQLITVPHSPSEIIKLIEDTKDAKQTIKLLALSSNRETICEPLVGIYLSVGKVKEAQLVIETLIQTYPKEAMYHLTLGNMFFGALYNATKPRIEKDPLYRFLTDKKHKPSTDEAWASQITLEALGCSYEFARKAAEEQFTEAMQLSRDKSIREQARLALVTLKMMDT